eukprot:TRINITY_DN15781_c0_g1_i1.p1 TRINITY_DN15781_c0_g1~~TRINITY_DN15781_c0_g1_i1.p1  ORF type:complete len:704 (-),score=298.23 TRINITY_DN15781_c0_g1_i1:55-2166(-)
MGKKSNKGGKGAGKRRDPRLGEKKYDEQGNMIDDRNTEAGKLLGYKDIVRSNLLFEKFYREQGICPEAEFEEMMECLKQDLPACFRISASRAESQALLKILETDYFAELTSHQAAGEDVVIPKLLPWYPDNLAYQLNLTRREIRRQEVYFKLHNFLVAETESGAISRQEAVSMLPPLVLGVKPHHNVLDMCAAPGSKTAQMIEDLHKGEEGELPTGLVVANDSDNARCYMLTHQAKRLQSPCVIITNHDATTMPDLMVPSPTTSTLTPMLYDRILCDVPCSGDGTMRKNPDIWPKWNPVNSSNLHGIQYRIARRALEMLAVGGRMVYSTCSFHPLENESVVARLLQDMEGRLQLVEVKDMLPGLDSSPGLETWTPASKQGEFYSSFDLCPPKVQAQIRPYMFPPPPSTVASLCLTKCVRVLPHKHNTGGFFVALLEKTGGCPWQEEGRKDSKEDKPDSPSVTEDPPEKKKRFWGFREDPFIYFKPEEPIYPRIRDYFKLSLPYTMFLTRCEDESKKNGVYFTTEKVRHVMENNVDRVKIINTGVKAFARCENYKGASCDYRIAQEGALSTVPFIGARMLHPAREDMEMMLLSEDQDKPPEITKMSEKFRDELEKTETGSVAFLFKDPTSSLTVKIVGWKGKMSVRAYVPRNDRLHYLRLIGADISSFEINKFKEKKQREQEREAAKEADANKLEDKGVFQPEK